MHPLSVYVDDRGLAINQVMTPGGRSFRMIPSVSDISLASGSVEGGTRLVISGDGFSAETPDDVRVVIGEAPCTVNTVSYKTVECVTTKPNAIGTFEPIVSINYIEAQVCNDTVCRYTYSSESTPVVTDVSPKVVSGDSTTLTISGSGFTNVMGDIAITVGGIECIVVHASGTGIQCSVGYVPSGNAQLVVNIAGQGNSALMFDGDTTALWSATDIYSVDPSAGSVEGGQSITIMGNGFHVDDTVVTIDSAECVIDTISLSQIDCKTGSHSAAVANLVVTSATYDYPATNYEYSSTLTPTISSVSPSNGETGDTIILVGSGFGSDVADNSVTIDGVECTVTSATSGSVECVVGSHSAGMYGVELYVNAIGYATSAVDFEYVLTVTSTTPTEGKLA